MKWSRFALLAGTGALAAALLAGTGQSQAPAADPAAAQFDLPDGVGKEQVMTACTTCHAISIVTAQRKSLQQWGDTVEMMMGRGAQVTEEDYPVIVEYLGAHLGDQPAKGPATAAARAPDTKTP
jgi:uncharacterized membrane protein